MEIVQVIEYIVRLNNCCYLLNFVRQAKSQYLRLEIVVQSSKCWFVKVRNSNQECSGNEHELITLLAIPVGSFGTKDLDTRDAGSRDCMAKNGHESGHVQPSDWRVTGTSSNCDSSQNNLIHNHQCI